MLTALRTLTVAATVYSLAIGCREADPAAGEGAARTQFPDSEPPWPGITLDLRPDVEHEELAVTGGVSGEHAEASGELTVASTWADTHGVDAISDMRANDREGSIPLVPRPAEAGDRVIGLSRTPRGGELLVRYRARSGSP